MGADKESRPKVIVLPAIQKQTHSLIIKIFSALEEYKKYSLGKFVNPHSIGA